MRGVVVAPQPRAAEAGAAALAQRGNAFDAAIAAAFMQVVTDPHICGLGGFGCATYAVDGQCWHVGFHARAGSLARPDVWADGIRGRMELGGYALFDDHRNNLGHQSVGTPGTVAGLAELHRHARLPWADLIEPAASLAREGFLAPEYMFDLARRLSTPGLPSSEERFAYTPASAALWCRDDGRALKQPGDHWSNPDLAATLDHLAQAGPRDFYEGDLARHIAAELERGGGLVTSDDLRNYRVRVAEPVTGGYRRYRVSSATPPASGATVLRMLQALDQLAPTVPDEPETWVVLAGIMRAAFAERASVVADPEFVPIPVAGTTHVSTYDEQGNAVALTHTLSLYSGVVVPGTGIMLNSAMDLFEPLPGRPNSIAPGKARVSGMAPTILFDGGRPALVTGAPGTNAIVTCIVQTIVGIVDGQLSPFEAVAAPRIHCEGGPVFVEGRVGQAGQQALREAGFDVRPMPGNYVPSMGRNQLIVIGPDGRFTGASDPRRDGGMAAYSRD